MHVIDTERYPRISMISPLLPSGLCGYGARGASVAYAYSQKLRPEFGDFQTDVVESNNKWPRHSPSYDRLLVPTISLRCKPTLSHSLTSHSDRN